MRGLFKLTQPEKPLGGRYKIIGELGAGGFGQTFLAEDLHLPDHPRCVVKQLKPQATDPNTLRTASRLFEMEAKVLYKLGNHDQIPRLLAHFEDNQEFYLAQELIEGESLTQELAGGQRWSQTWVVAFLQDLLHVLSFVHQQNVIHRDIKPSNLMRRRQDGRIVLIDFGAVKQVSTQVTNPKTGNTKTISIGTQGYTPKEQLGGNPRFSSDLYAVGMIAIQALTGIHPRRLTEDPQTGEINWRIHVPQVRSELAEILDCMVRYDYRVRYPMAAQALEAMRSLPTSLTQSVPFPQPLSGATGATPSTDSELGEASTQRWASPEHSVARQSTESTDSELGEASTQRWASPEHSVARQSTESTDSQFGEASTQRWVSPEHSVARQPTESTDSQFGEASTQRWVPPEHSVARQPTESTESEFREASTQRWVPPAPPVQPQPPVSSPSSTDPSGQSQRSPQSASSAPPVAAPGGVQKQSIMLGSVLAVSVAVGATFLLTKTFLAPQPPSQTANRSGEPTASPSANPTALPSPDSSSATSPTASPADTSASPSPGSSPTATQASPTPATPAAQSTPAPAPEVGEVMSQADRLREAGQYQKAIDLYDQAIALKPDIAEAHWGRCNSLNSLQQPDDAIAACNEALGIKPDYPEALWSKGAALEQQNPTEALKLYQKATTLKPNFAEAWNNQGVALLKLGRTTEAVTALDKATTLKSDFADAWANKGAALWELGRNDDAIASMDKALQLQPNNPDVIHLRQLAREKVGR